MANVTVPYSEAGLAAFEQLDTFLQKFVLMGEHPRLAAGVFTVKANEVLEQFTVVGISAGKIEKAQFDGDPKAVGVLTQAVTGNAGGTTTVAVWYSGNFNIDALVWDASYDTDAKKLAAFDGADTPTTIRMGKRGS